jgi:acetoin utilization deacetylase AcuC-like enzyme
MIRKSFLFKQLEMKTLSTGIVYTSRYLDHDTGPFHPESPARLLGIAERLERNEIMGKPFGATIAPRIASREEIELVHSPGYIGFVKECCEKGVQRLDSDTPICPESYDVALLAAGGVLLACERVNSREFDNAIALVRPPGHHAGANGRALTASSAGFCIFNNIAVAAMKLIKNVGFQRVLILDFDCQHGNGTQEIFYEDDTVLYISLHQYPFYPGTGSAAERGHGRGEGFTVNCPMGAGSVEKDYLDAFQAQVLPALHRFQPQLLLISAGFDAHTDDPLASINLTEGSFARLTEHLLGISDKYCGGKVVSILEGGYNLQALARSVEAHLNVMV